MPNDPKECRMQARCCADLAFTAATPQARELFASLAKCWIKLARIFRSTGRGERPAHLYPMTGCVTETPANDYQPESGWRRSGGARRRLFNALSNCFSETGFCRSMRSRSFSRAPTLALSFFTSTTRASSLGRPFQKGRSANPKGRPKAHATS